MGSPTRLRNATSPKRPSNRHELSRPGVGLVGLGLLILSSPWLAQGVSQEKPTTNQEVRRFEGHIGGITSVAFSPDGRSALSGSLDTTLRLWDVSTGKEIRQFTGHTDWVFSVAFSPDGRSALSGSRDKTLRLWEVATGKEIRRFTGHTSGVESVAFSPDGRYALSGSSDKTLRLWALPEEVWLKK
ncbi:WD40 repeat domain-containing protein [Thermogemmata fonticola]|uniref:WD40 repeat domain-containing protein n=1 Tax=Thermogemmata fonticola TaxID=2755323 RepID=A0A7V9ACN8_9BACT|nr:WD40 repeat domain-containing protein [Thermogemmata fonticola]MBA2227511.1 WD40 repeat domain-containing protein [Thermogemmata fonticola]